MGFVIIIPAMSSPSRGFRDSTSTRPLAPDFTTTVSSPQTAAEAGFVPCALSGTMTLVLALSPRLMWYSLISIRPVSSPWAPAQGRKVKRFMPVIAASALSRPSIASSAPRTVDSGCRGCSPANPGIEDTSSFILGLYFIVHEPSG